MTVTLYVEGKNVELLANTGGLPCETFKNDPKEKIIAVLHCWLSRSFLFYCLLFYCLHIVQDKNILSIAAGTNYCELIWSVVYST